MSTVMEEMPSVTFEIDTPDGRMYVTIMEDTDTGFPIRIQVIIGKAGTELMSWAQSVSDLCSELLACGKGISDLLAILSQQTASRGQKISQAGEIVRSGPEGICVAIMNYRRMKFSELKTLFGGASIDD